MGKHERRPATDDRVQNLLEMCERLDDHHVSVDTIKGVRQWCGMLLPTMLDADSGLSRLLVATADMCDAMLILRDTVDDDNEWIDEWLAECETRWRAARTAVHITAV